MPGQNSPQHTLRTFTLNILSKTIQNTFQNYTENITDLSTTHVNLFRKQLKNYLQYRL